VLCAFPYCPPISPQRIIFFRSSRDQVLSLLLRNRLQHKTSLPGCPMWLFPAVWSLPLVLFYPSFLEFTPVILFFRALFHPLGPNRFLGRPHYFLSTPSVPLHFLFSASPPGGSLVHLPETPLVFTHSLRYVLAAPPRLF